MYLKLLSTIPLIFKNKFYIIHLTSYHWQPCILQVCNITKGVLKVRTGSLGQQVPVAVAKISDLVTHCYQLVIALLGLQEFLRNCTFYDVKTCEM